MDGSSKDITMGRLRFLLLALALPLSLACASVGPFSSPTGGKPWEVPEEAYPTQRLFRIKYAGPEGKAGFKLTLYLETAERYRMQAADSLGRKLWSLDLDARGRATWLDHRRETFCHTVGSQLDFVPLARLPLMALPKLLLGRLPTSPAGRVEGSTTDGAFSFLDASGQRFRGNLVGGGLLWWTLEENSKPVAWWRQEDEGASFVHRGTQQEVRWREVVREPLAGGLEGLVIPADYSERDCGQLDGRPAGEAR